MEFTRMLTRRTVMLLLLTTVIVLFTLYTKQSGSKISIFDNVLTSTYNIRLKSEPHPKSEVMSLEQTHHRKEWSPYMDILSENDVMKDKPLTDVKQGLSSELSRVVIKGNSKEYRIGDEIRISIIALDGYGKIRKRGGDQFRVRVFEQRLKASASGYVVDHKNGSYTAVIRALWSGAPKISIVNAFPREIVRAWYYTMNKLPGTRVYEAKYQVKINSTTKQLQGMCHVMLDQITKISQNFCNKTQLNGGAFLYCVRPKLASCDNFIGFGRRDIGKTKAFNKAEVALSNRFGQVLKSPQISVKEQQKKDNRRIPYCVNYNITKLWEKESPVGFFYNNTWRTLHCKGLSTPSLEGCVRNKQFILIGDSTLRQWYDYFMVTYNCTQTTHATRRMYKFCRSIEYNMSVELIFHSIPGHHIVQEPGIHSIQGFLNDYQFSPDRVLVFHMQSHLSTHHPRVFRARMLVIRKSIDSLLTKYRHLRIYFKGPHTFKPRYHIFCDYFGYVYRTIMLEVFDGLYDKIVYLDSKDMTIATAQIDNHPTSEVVRGMVEQFLSYVCYPV